jgi:cytochrome c oxidase subunit I
MSIENHGHHASEQHLHDEHHHEESFITKYVFSMDHKTISRQFLITAVIMAVIAMIMSTLFRLQLAWPERSFSFINMMVGDRWGKDGILDPNMYLALVTIHGTIMVFFVLTGGLSGTFSNLLIPYQIGARDMASGFLNMLSYWFFFLSSCVMLISLTV